MADPLTFIQKCELDDWLVGYDSLQFACIAQQLYLELTKLANSPKILLAEPEPVRFLAGFIAAVAAGCPVFLCNPNWVKQEWQQVLDLVQPDIIWGQEAGELGSWGAGELRKEGDSGLRTLDFGLIMIPTGGSSGQIRFAMHTWETLMTSVQGFTQYFQVSQVNSFCVLPLYHVSGLMQFMRAIATGGKLAILPFKEIEGRGDPAGHPSGQRCDIDLGEFFISLVPTQLQRLLQNPETAIWLSRFKTVLLGGAPAWSELLEMARRDRIPLALTYGMTETASQIATLKPANFIAGNNSCGQILPHAKVTIRTPTGEILGANQTGIITIQADSLALGYYPSPNTVHPTPFQADDLGFLDDKGYLHIIGRNSDKIITGGENVFPAEVEAAILATGLVADVCAIAIPDRHWGQAVTAVYVPIDAEVSDAALGEAIADKLAKFKRPKYWVPVESLPRNSQGKMNRLLLQEIVNPKLL